MHHGAHQGHGMTVRDDAVAWILASIKVANSYILCNCSGFRCSFTQTLPKKIHALGPLLTTTKDVVGWEIF